MVKFVAGRGATTSFDTVVNVVCHDFQYRRSSINTLANRSSSCDVFDTRPNGADCTVTHVR